MLKEILKKEIRFLPKKSCYIDNIVFRLHYVITFAFLVLCTVLIGSREYMKEHISCLAEKDYQPFFNTYCFITTTFTVVKHHKLVGDKILTYPGVGPYTGDKDEPIIRHAYYQWVPFVLFGQAFLFYLPHFIWKRYENGRMEAIVNYINVSLEKDNSSKKKTKVNERQLQSETSRLEKTKWVKDHYLFLTRFKLNNDWAKYLVLCEILNAINLICQIMLVNVFLQGNFIDLGIKWYHEAEYTLDLVFPKLTKCTFYKVGPTGSVQLIDTLCVMSLNIINEKIYCVLWFWFLTLFIITVLGLIWRILTFLLHKRSPVFNKWVWGELSPGPAINREDIKIITKNLCFSDWLFLYYLGKNIDGQMFRNMVTYLAETYEKAPFAMQNDFEKVPLAIENDYEKAPLAIQNDYEKAPLAIQNDYVQLEPSKESPNTKDESFC